MHSSDFKVGEKSARVHGQTPTLSTILQEAQPTMVSIGLCARFCFEG